MLEGLIQKLLINGNWIYVCFLICIFSYTGLMIASMKEKDPDKAEAFNPFYIILQALTGILTFYSVYYQGLEKGRAGK